MKENLFFQSLICFLKVVGESSMLLGVAGLASHLFDGGAEVSAFSGVGFLILAVVVSIGLKFGERK